MLQPVALPKFLTRQGISEKEAIATIVRLDSQGKGNAEIGAYFNSSAPSIRSFKKNFMPRFVTSIKSTRVTTYKWLIGSSIPDTVVKVRQLYIVEDKTMTEIAALLGAPECQMIYFLRKYIPTKGKTNGRSKLPEVLSEDYLNKDKAAREENRFYSVHLFRSNPTALENFNGVVA